MNAQPANGDGAAGPRKRKIDRSEWPTLLARREAGATQAQIAQDYGVSQGTVSQILKRARAEAEGQPVADLDSDAASEVEGSGTAGSGSTPATPTDAAPAEHEAHPAAEASEPGAGVSRSGADAASEAPTPRRTLTTRSKSAAEAPSTAGSTTGSATQSATGQSASGQSASAQSAQAQSAYTGSGDTAPRGAAAPAAGNGDASAATAQPAETGARGAASSNPLAARLRDATERCAQLVDQKATSENLSSAVHEVRRALAAIEIDAAKQNSPAAQRPRQAPPTRPSQSASAPAQQPPRAPDPIEPPRREPGVDPSKAAGRVKFFKPEKGFGFIIPDDGGDDIFVGKDTVQAAGIERLSEGDRVRYTPGPGAKGLEAKTIERIG
jgi:CspA family cold shock protein